MISIIIPVWNQGEELKNCLKSIHAQTIKQYEIVIVNDRSTDRLSSRIRQERKLFGDKLSLYHNQTNHGPQYTRNKGFRFSRGEFIIFCDADVVMQPEMLELMLEELRLKPEASYAYSSFKWAWKKFKLFPFSAERLRQMPYIHTTSLIRREHFPGFDENIKRLQDWDLWLTMLESGHNGTWIDKILFRIQGGGHTMSGWVPSFAYKLLPFLKQSKKYENAKAVIVEKHKLNPDKG